MFENNPEYVKRVVQFALREENIPYHSLSINTERIPLQIETYKSSVRGITVNNRKVKLSLDIEVAPLYNTTFDIKMKGLIDGQSLDKKISFTTYDVEN